MEAGGCPAVVNYIHLFLFQACPPRPCPAFPTGPPPHPPVGHGTGRPPCNAGEMIVCRPRRRQRTEMRGAPGGGAPGTSMSLQTRMTVVHFPVSMLYPRSPTPLRRGAWGSSPPRRAHACELRPPQPPGTLKRGRVRVPRPRPRGQRDAASGSVPRAVGVGRSRAVGAASGCSRSGPPVPLPLLSLSGL